ncbi:MAG: FtsX-like permease family protein [Acidimicrobiales bacterium]
MAALSFSLLTSEAKTSRVVITGTVTANFRPAYDLVIRPKGSVTSFERRQRVVEDGFLSGIFGGITLAQWRTIQRLPGVAVAAPVANVGSFLLTGNIYVSLPRAKGAGSGSQALYRFSTDWVVHDGLESYPGGMEYLYSTTNPLVLSAGRYYPREVVPGSPHPLDVCGAFARGAPATTGPASPFSAPKPLASPYAIGSGLTCTSTVERFPPGSVVPNTDRAGQRAVSVSFEVPILVSGIDPASENQLLDFAHTVVSGRYLREGEGLSAPVRLGTPSPQAPYTREVPVLASDKTFLDQVAHVVVSRLQVPPGTSLPRALASSDAYRFVTHLRGHPVEQVKITPGEVYDGFLNQLGQRPNYGTGAITSFTGTGFTGSYWTVGPTRYRPVGPSALAAETVPNDPSVWFEKTTTPSEGGSLAPAGSQDTWFRGLAIRSGSGSIRPTSKSSPAKGHPVFDAPALKVVGRFDPGRLPSFSPLSRVPLSTYFPPQVEPGGPVAAGVLGKRALGPTTNLGGYVPEPPLFLTTIKGAEALEDPNAFAGASQKAPISAIRVKVTGVTGPNPASLAKIRLVAQEITDEVGLPLQVTAGSSPTRERISLAKGCCGRPAMAVSEGWSKEGTDVAILQALDQKDIALFALVLVICGLFVANGTLASVRGRRVEIATLRTFGWTRPAVFSVVIAEVLLVGVVAGAVATGIALGLVLGASLVLSPLQLGLIVPIALGLAGAAGVVPAWRATSIAPLEALTPALSVRASRRRVRGVVRMGLGNLARLPTRSALGATGLAVGVGSLALLLGIQFAFRGEVAGTLLGGVVTLQVRSVDFASAALAVVLGAVSVADVLFLNLRERTAELAMLRATGWTNADVIALAATEGLGIGLLGASVGAAAGVAVVGLLGGAVGPVAEAAVLGALAGVVLSALALSVPLWVLNRRLPARALAGE